MTLTPDLQTSFKVNAYPLIKGTMWVKYEPDWCKGRADMLQTRTLFNSALTLTFDLESWFKITTYLLKALFM